MTICRDTALRIYEICKGEPADADPDETASQIESEIRRAMFQAAYCSPRCDSTQCKQSDGGDGT